MSTIDEIRRTSFDRGAEAYDTVRPSYPDALIDDLVERSALPPDGRILEIGAGTGKATVALARRGHRLVALEPSPNMANLLRRNVAAFPRVNVLESRFEDWTDVEGAFDLVAAAQSFHWVAPEIRLAKSADLLRPGGSLAILTNEKRDLDPGLRADFDEAYARCVPSEAHAAVLSSGALLERDQVDEIDSSARFGPVHVGQFPWSETYATRSYVALLSTYSDHAVLEEHRRLALFEAIAAAIDRRGGRITVPYVAWMFLARRRSG